MLVALIFLVIGGVLLRYGVTKRGTKVAFLINAAGLIAIVIFVILTFKSFQEMTNPIDTPVEQERDTTSSE